MSNGFFVIITRNGSLGSRFPLNFPKCLFGQSSACDVRVHVASVAQKHCVITIQPDKKAYIKNLSPSNATFVNNQPLGDSNLRLEHADVITIGSRHFLWEYPSASLSPKNISSSTSVQIPMADIKSKKFSTPQYIKGQGEPSAKRRKTLSNVTDLGVENTLAKPVNKRLQALTQPASRPKSFSTFRVLLKSASKRKSLSNVSKTPNKTTVVSTKVQRSKSLLSLSKGSQKSPKTNQQNKSPKVLSPSNNTISEVVCITPGKSLSSKNASTKKSSSKARPSLKTPSKTVIINSPLVKSSPLAKATPARKSSISGKANHSLRSSAVSSKNKSLNNSKINDLSVCEITTPTLSKNSIGSPISSPSSSRRSQTRSSDTLESPSVISPNILMNNSCSKELSTTKTAIREINALSTPMKTNTPKRSESLTSAAIESPSSSRRSQTRLDTLESPSIISPNILKNNSRSKELSTTKTPVRELNAFSTPMKTETPKVSVTSEESLTSAAIEFPSSSRRSQTRSSDTLESPSIISPNKFNNNSRSKEFLTIKTPIRELNALRTPLKTKTPKVSVTGTESLKSAAIESPSSSRRMKRSFQTLESPLVISPNKLNNNSPSKVLHIAKNLSKRLSVSTTPLKENTPNMSINGYESVSKLHSPRVSVSSSKIKKSVRLSRTSTPLLNTPGRSLRNRLSKTPNTGSSKTNSSRFLSKISLAKIDSPEMTGNISDISTKGKTPVSLSLTTPKGSTFSISPKSSSLKNRSPVTPRSKSTEKLDASYSSFDLAYHSSPEPSLIELSVISDKTIRSSRGRPKSAEKNKSSRKESLSPYLKSEVSNLSSGRTNLKRSPRKSNSIQTIEEDCLPFMSDSLLSLNKTKSENNVNDNKRRGRSSSKILDITNTSFAINESKKTPKSLKNISGTSQEDPGSPQSAKSSDKSPRTPHSNSFLDAASSTKQSQISSSVNKSYGDNNDSEANVHDTSLGRKNSSRNKSPSTQSLDRTPRKNEPKCVQQSSEKFGSPLKSPSVTPKLKTPVEHCGSSKITKPPNIGSEEKTIPVSDGKRRSARRSILRSSSTSLKDSVNSSFKTISPKSSTKTADIVKLQNSVKRKFNDFEARAERAAKKLKMETPKSLSKNKVAALLVCHGRSPKNIKPKPLFSEVLKSRLSAIKRNPPKNSESSATVKVNVKRKPFQPSLEKPTTFNFNSTGHANSPETIVITKKQKKTPAPKTRKGRKSEVIHLQSTAAEQDLEGVNELFKTPSKSILSSLKSASSMRKTKSKVRFSLQNDVQSPSGRRSSAKHSDDLAFSGSPIVSSKRYGTPRPGRFSELSLLHTSIAEESPLAEEIDKTNSEIRKSKSSLRSKSNNQSFDFSAYSPSSPTLQFSNISISCEDQSTNQSQNSFVSEFSKSPKRKRSLVENTAPLPSSIRRFSFASRISNITKNSTQVTSPSLGDVTRTSSNDISIVGSFNTPGNKSKKSTRSVSSDSIHESCEFSPNSSKNFKRSGRKSSVSKGINISQIPLPPGSPEIKGNKSLSFVSSTSQESQCSTSLKNAELNSSNTTGKGSKRRSTSKLLTSSDSIVETSGTPSFVNSTKIENYSLRSSKLSSINNTSTNSVANITDSVGRVSSTPNPLTATNIYSPLNSPIARLSIKNTSIENETQYVKNDEKLLDEASLQLTSADFNTPQTMPGRKSKKGSARMNASNISLLTPEGQVPVATVRPSTRKKQVNESVSSVADSVTLPSFSLSHEVSGRSLDRNIDQKMFDSRVNSYTQLSENVATVMSPLNKTTPSTLALASSSNRKRKSSASLQSLTNNSFDFSSVVTPKIPKEMFVSALSNAESNLSSIEGVKRIFNPRENSPISSYVDVKGVKRLLKTPQPPTPAANYTRVEGIKQLFKHSPVPDYTNVIGIKRIYGAQPEPNYMNVKGVRRIFKDNKMPNSPDVSGVEVLFESPKKNCKLQQYPKPLVKVPPMTRASSSKIDNENVSLSPVDVLEDPVVQSRDIISETNSTSRGKLILTGDEKSEPNCSPAGVRKTRKTINEPKSQEQVNNSNSEIKSKGETKENVNKNINAHISAQEDTNGTSKLKINSTNQIQVKKTRSNTIDLSLIPVEESRQLDNMTQTRNKRSKVKMVQEIKKNDSLGKGEIDTGLANDHKHGPSPKRTRRGKPLDLIEAVEVSNDNTSINQQRKRGRSKNSGMEINNVNNVSENDVVSGSKITSADNQALANVENSTITSVTTKIGKKTKSDLDKFPENYSGELSKRTGRVGKKQVNCKIIPEIGMDKLSTRSTRNQLTEIDLKPKHNESELPGVRSRNKKIKNETQESIEPTSTLDKAKSTTRSKINEQAAINVKSALEIETKVPSRSRRKTIKNETQERNDDSAQKTTKSTTRPKANKQSETVESCTIIEPKISSRSRGRIGKAQIQENKEDSSEQSTTKSTTRSKRSKQSETAPETSTEIKPEPTSRSKSRTEKSQNQEGNEDSLVLDIVKSTRSRRNQQSGTVLESIKVELKAPSRSKKVKIKTEEDSQKEKTPGLSNKSQRSTSRSHSSINNESDMKNDTTEVLLKSKKKQNICEPSTELDMALGKNVAKTVVKGDLDTVNSKQCTTLETLYVNTKKTVRRNKIHDPQEQLKVSPSPTIKGKRGRTKQNIPNLKEVSLENSSSQSGQKKISPETGTSRTSKRVNFNSNTVKNNSPDKQKRAVKKSAEKVTEVKKGVTNRKSPTVKTKPAPKGGKAKRNSSTPVKTPPAKRITRSRK